MMIFSKLLPNFAAESTMASLHMPVYWSSASDILFHWCPLKLINAFRVFKLIVYVYGKEYFLHRKRLIYFTVWLRCLHFVRFNF